MTTTFKANTKSFCVEILANGDGHLRMVEIENPQNLQDGLLDQIFHFGQNDFQPMPLPSVSSGDVIQIPFEGSQIKFFLVMPVGFEEVTQSWLEEYRKTPSRDRLKILWDLEEHLDILDCLFHKDEKYGCFHDSCYITGIRAAWDIWTDLPVSGSYTWNEWLQKVFTCWDHVRNNVQS